jgi:hypothetical protein
VSLGYRTWLLWPWVGLVIVGFGFLADPWQIFWMTGTILCLMGISGVGGWFFGLIDCQATYDSCCVLPPEESEDNAGYVLVRGAEGKWTWWKVAVELDLGQREPQEREP